MMTYWKRHIVVIGLLMMTLGISLTQAQDNLPLDTIQLPPGFTISLYAGDVNGARSLALGDEGTLFVGSRAAGNVYAITDANDDGVSDQTRVIARGLNNPNGVAFHDGALYVAEISRIIRYDDIEASLDNPPAPVVVFDQLPTEEYHGWKYLRVGPDDKLYVPVGVPCNVCAEDDRYGLIYRLNLDGSGLEVVVRGVRNSVGFDWDAQTGELWFTDNGRDWVSDDLPPDELNHVTEDGQHFGFPYCHAGFLADSDFGTRPCSEFTAPAQPLGPHVAPLGLRFYTGDMFPVAYQNQLFIAEHGSWNRSIPIGYRLSLARLADNQVIAYEPFAEGWLQADGGVWGRPVDVLVMPDGALLVSDDVANAVYRITYSA